MVVPEKILTPEEVRNGYELYLTVGKLLEFIEKHDLPKDAKVVFQRIEDRYFEKHGWGVVLKEGFHYHSQVKRNKDIDNGEFDDPEEYPLLKGKRPEKFPEDKLDELKEQYIPIWCPVKYEDDDNLYLDAHY